MTKWHNEFDKQVQLATAGVPRLILYTLRTVHHLRALHPDKVKLDSKKAIGDAMDQVYLQLDAHGIIDREISGGGVTRATFGLPWLWLQLVAWLGAPVDETWRLPFDILEARLCTLARMLGSVPFFAAAHDKGKIKLGRAGFALMAARDGIIRTIGSDAAAAVHHWRLLDERVMAALGLMLAVGHHTRQTWGQACFFLDHSAVPGIVKDDHVHVPGCGMLAPATTLELSNQMRSAKEQQAELAQQLAELGPGTTVKLANDLAGGYVCVIGASFNLYMQCKKANPSKTQTRLSGKDLIEGLKTSLTMAESAPKTHQVLVVCSTQQPDDDVQKLLEGSMAKTKPNPRSELQATHEMAVLNAGSHVVTRGKGKDTLDVPTGWTVIVLGVAASHQLSKLGAAALQFVRVNERVQAR